MKKTAVYKNGQPSVNLRADAKEQLIHLGIEWLLEYYHLLFLDFSLGISGISSIKNILLSQFG